MSDAELWKARCLKAHAMLDELALRTNDRAVVQLARRTQEALITYRPAAKLGDGCPECGGKSIMFTIERDNDTARGRCDKCGTEFEVST